MTNSLAQLLLEVEAYAAEAGTSPQAVLRAATGNPRLYKRMQEHAGRIDDEVGRIRKYLHERRARDALN